MKQFEELEQLLKNKKSKDLPMDDKTSQAKEEVLKELIEMMQGIRSSRLDNEMKIMRNNPLSHMPDRAARKAEHTVDRMPALPEEGDAEEVANESDKETTKQDMKPTGPNISEEEPMSFMEKKRKKAEKK